MRTRPPLEFKRITDQIAKLAATRAGASLLNLMASLEAGSRPIESRVATNTPGPIGIWHPKSENGNTEWIRAKTDQRTLWANVDRIGPKTDRYRVLLHGESVARGFLYDPGLSCANVLQTIFDSAGAKVEVVDLARTDIQQHQLLALMRASVALRPDAVILFAGNNWSPLRDLSWIEMIDLTERLLEVESWLPAREILENKLKTDTRAFFEVVHELWLKHDIPFVAMIPEFNLLDWKTHGVELPFLKPSASEAWLEARGLAERAMENNEWGLAASTADEMIALDGGCTPFPLEIKARQAMTAGNLSCARRLLEKVRDTEMLYPERNSPRCYGVVQQEIRGAAARLRFPVIDLPARMEEWQPGELPGRKMFADYCHLTFEGIRGAMASAAACLLPQTGLGSANWQDLAAVPVPVSPSILGRASMLAALKNSNRGQSRAIVRYHCEQAVELDPAVKARLRDIIDFQIRREPYLLCRSFREFAASEPETTRYYLNPIVTSSRLVAEKSSEWPLIGEAVEVLSQTDESIREWSLELLLQHRGVSKRHAVDLLDRFYKSGNRTNEAQSNSNFYTAFEMRSRFVLVCAEPSDLMLTVGCRVPGHDGADGEIQILVNEIPIAQVCASPSWMTSRVSLPAAVVRRGYNHIELHWPLAPEPWRSSLERGLRILYERQESAPARFRPVFGHLSVLTVGTAGV